MALTPAVHLTPAHVCSAAHGNHGEVWDRGCQAGRGLGGRSPGLLTGGRCASGAGVHAARSVRGPALPCRVSGPHAGSQDTCPPKVPPALGSPASAAVPWGPSVLQVSAGGWGTGRTRRKRDNPPSRCFPSQMLPRELLWAEPRKMAGPGVYLGDLSRASPLRPAERNWALASGSPGPGAWPCAGPGYGPGSENRETWSSQALQRPPGPSVMWFQQRAPLGCAGGDTRGPRWTSRNCGVSLSLPVSVPRSAWGRKGLPRDGRRVLGRCRAVVLNFPTSLCLLGLQEMGVVRVPGLSGGLLCGHSSPQTL